MRFKEVVDDDGFVVDPVTGERFPDFLEVRKKNRPQHQHPCSRAALTDGGAWYAGRAAWPCSAGVQGFSEGRVP